MGEARSGAWRARQPEITQIEMTISRTGGPDLQSRRENHGSGAVMAQIRWSEGTPIHL
jgi:hypothetical protein